MNRRSFAAKTRTWGAGLAAAAAAWSGLLPGGVARAADEWCDSDPLRLINTEDGRPLPALVFYTVGGRVRHLLDLPRILAIVRGTLLQVRCTSEAVPGGTKVTLTVTVPSGSGEPFMTRLVVSAGPLDSLTRYSEVYGVSGEPMVAQFVLPAA